MNNLLLLMNQGGGLHYVDYAVILISLIVSLYVGFHFSKGQKSTKKYFAADGNIAIAKINCVDFDLQVLVGIAYIGRFFQRASHPDRARKIVVVD